MARWLLFFAEYNIVVYHMPGKSSILADARSRRPDYDPRADLGCQLAAEDDGENDSHACTADEFHAMSPPPVFPLRR